MRTTTPLGRLSSTTATTQLLQVGDAAYAYRRLGKSSRLPLLLLQHFTGTLDNWDPAVTDKLADNREIILFDNAGVGRSSGQVPRTIAEMAGHAFAFLDGLGIKECDVLGYSLGGMIAQQMALDRPSIFRRIILAGTGPRGGDDIMHIEKPELARYFKDPSLDGYKRLQKIFFAPTETSQRAGEKFVDRLQLRTSDRDRPSGPEVAQAQIAAFREWEQFTGERFAQLREIKQPTLVVNGLRDALIPISNSYRLVENLPSAMLIVYPDSGHGSLFQFHQSFTRQVEAFLASRMAFIPG
jgi:pimeloyl-ACP methyl ester carboxylesterase